MWSQVTDAVGDDERDRLWSHPDLLPTSDDIDDPSSLVARLTASASGAEPEYDELDEAIAAMLSGEDIEGDDAEGATGEHGADDSTGAHGAEDSTSGHGAEGSTGEHGAEGSTGEHGADTGDDEGHPGDRDEGNSGPAPV
jgi:hypothetical protein